MTDLSRAEKRAISGKKRKLRKSTNLGVVSFAFLILAGFMAISGLREIGTILSCGRLLNLDNTKYGVAIIVASLIVTILAISCAGAAMATNRGSFLGLLVIGLSIVPFLYFIGMLLVDFPALDFTSASNAAPPQAVSCNYAS